MDKCTEREINILQLLHAHLNNHTAITTTSNNIISLIDSFYAKVTVNNYTCSVMYIILERMQCSLLDVSILLNYITLTLLHGIMNYVWLRYQ